jgi:hypothetical protein
MMNDMNESGIAQHESSVSDFKQNDMAGGNKK